MMPKPVPNVSFFWRLAVLEHSERMHLNCYFEFSEGNSAQQQNCCCLTLELSRHRRCGALDSKRKMGRKPSA